MSMHAPTTAFVTVCKDEGDLLHGLVESISCLPFCERIALVDVDSTDASEVIARKLFSRVHMVRFPESFGELCWLAHRLCAPADYSFRLDCDERLDVPVVGGCWSTLLTKQRYNLALSFARRRWKDLTKHQQLDAGNADWQPRMLPLNSNVRFERRVHVDVTGVNIERSDIFVIDHFHDCMKSATALQAREVVYQRLAKLEGIAVEGGEGLNSVCKNCGHLRYAHSGSYHYGKPPFGCADCYCPGFTAFEE